MRQLRRLAALMAVALFLGSSQLRAEPFPAEAIQKADAQTVRVITRVVSLTHMAGFYDEAGDTDAAERCISQAVEDLQALDQGIIKDWLRNKTGNKLAGLGQFERAETLAKQIDDPALAGHLLAKMGEKWIKSGGEDSQGKKWINAALNQDRRIIDPARRIVNRSTIIGCLASIEATERAQELVDQTLLLLDAVDSDEERVILTAELGTKLLAVGELDRGTKLYDSIFETSSVALKLEIASEYAEAGEESRSIDWLRAATEQLQAPMLREVAEDAANSPSRPKLLATLADKYGKLEDFETALGIVDQIDDAHMRAYALSKIAKSRRADKERAAELLEQAAEMARSAEDPIDRLEMLLAVSKGYVQSKVEGPVQDLLGEAGSIVKSLSK